MEGNTNQYCHNDCGGEESTQVLCKTFSDLKAREREQHG
jgi:hypothetical protein